MHDAPRLGCSFTAIEIEGFIRRTAGVDNEGLFASFGGLYVPREAFLLDICGAIGPIKVEPGLAESDHLGIFRKRFENFG